MYILLIINLLLGIFFSVSLYYILTVKKTLEYTSYSSRTVDFVPLRISLLEFISYSVIMFIPILNIVLFLMLLILSVLEYKEDSRYMNFNRKHANKIAQYYNFLYKYINIFIKFKTSIVNFFTQEL